MWNVVQYNHPFSGCYSFGPSTIFDYQIERTQGEFCLGTNPNTRRMVSEILLLLTRPLCRHLNDDLCPKDTRSTSYTLSMTLKQLYQAISVSFTMYCDHVVPELVLCDHLIQGVIQPQVVRLVSQSRCILSCLIFNSPFSCLSSFLLCWLQESYDPYLIIIVNACYLPGHILNALGAQYN